MPPTAPVAPVRPIVIRSLLGRLHRRSPPCAGRATRDSRAPGVGSGHATGRTLVIQLAKGANAPLTSTTVTATVEVGAAADLSALLVTETGKVRSDADFVFYNQPTGPGVRCVPPTGGRPWQVEVDLTQVPPDVHAVRLVTSRDDQGRVFGEVGQPVARIADRGGTPLAEFAMTGLGPESIVVALELYRRAGGLEGRGGGEGGRGGGGRQVHGAR